MPDPTRTIRQTRLLPAKPVQVYDALVNAKKHAAFTGAPATGAARAGARFTAWGGYIEGKHLELAPARLIVQEWKTAEWPEGAPPSRVEWRIEAAKGGTRVTLIHSEVPAQQAESYRTGWIEYYWKPLRQYFSLK